MSSTPYKKNRPTPVGHRVGRQHTHTQRKEPIKPPIPKRVIQPCVHSHHARLAKYEQSQI